MPQVARRTSSCAAREARECKRRAQPQKRPQVFAAVSVSTGCLSYGICMAYTSSAIPSMMASPLRLTEDQAAWMSEW